MIKKHLILSDIHDIVDVYIDLLTQADSLCQQGTKKKLTHPSAETLIQACELHRSDGNLLTTEQKETITAIIPKFRAIPATTLVEMRRQHLITTLRDIAVGVELYRWRRLYHAEVKKHAKK